jgi:UDP-N-acetylmuramate dehydrogenase
LASACRRTDRRHNSHLYLHIQETFARLLGLILPALSNLTTVGIGGEITDYLEINADDFAAEDDILSALKNAIKGAHTPLLVIGGGSNILPHDGKYSGSILKLTGGKLPAVADSNREERTTVRLWGGILLDDVAKHCGLAALSGIPGTLGGAVVQNAGAYGEEISQYVHAVWAIKLDQSDAGAGGEKVRRFNNTECEFSYRNSFFKRSVGVYKSAPNSPEYIIPYVELTIPPKLQEVKYAGLADALGVEVGAKMHADEIRQAVLKVRDAKGMLAPDFPFGNASDPDRRSTGSFFKNPIVKASLVPDGAPSWAMQDGLAKVSAAWLIEHAGFTRAYASSTSCNGSTTRADISQSASPAENGLLVQADSAPALLPSQSVRLSSKHVLALVNATPEGYSTPGGDMRELAKQIQQAVFSKFGIELHPEVVML